MTTNLTDTRRYVVRVGERARVAACALRRASTAAKDAALEAMAGAIAARREQIATANAQDMAAARRDGLDAALLDRLELTAARIEAMIEGLRQVRALQDPVGEIAGLRRRPSGIQVGRMRVPLGVIGIIYESRPNVTVDAAALCLKAGNAAILRGGSEALRSNLALAACIETGLAQADLPTDGVQVLKTTDRDAVGVLITASESVDVIIPRGGKGLIERIAREATVPVIKHLHGVCHVYIDDRANLVQGAEIAFNAKTQRYGTCNTMETLLVAQGVAGEVLPALARRYQQAGVELRGCERARALVPEMDTAREEDWSTEYLAPVLAVRIVDDLAQAMAHIERFGSGHTDAIVTTDYARAQTFLREVDSSSVMVNASTRFADGFEYGLGAEIGISTDRLHVRGPVGLEGLTTQKYIVLGDGQLRQ